MAPPTVGLPAPHSLLGIVVRQSPGRDGCTTLELLQIRSLHTRGCLWPRAGPGQGPETRDLPQPTGSTQQLGVRSLGVTEANCSSGTPWTTGFPSSRGLVLGLSGVVVSRTKSSSAADLDVGERRGLPTPLLGSMCFCSLGTPRTPQAGRQRGTSLDLGLRGTPSPKVSPSKNAVLTFL